MDSFVQMVADKLGLDPAVTRHALAAVLRFLDEQTKNTSFDFDTILSGLNGAKDLLQEDEKQERTKQEEETKQEGSQEATGQEHTAREAVGKRATTKPTGIVGLIVTLLQVFGVLDFLKRFLEPLFGEKAVRLIESVQEGAELKEMLEQLGLNREQGINLIQMLFSYMKDQLNPDVVDNLTEQIPVIKNLLAESKKEE